MKKIFLGLSVSIALLSGCATTSGLEAKTKVSEFDGSKSVSVSPHAIACKTMTCVTTGFVWNDKNPSQASTLVAIMSPSLGGTYHAISSVKLNIDGDIVTLKASPGDSNDFKDDNTYKTTSRLYMTPLSLLERIEKSTTTKMQVIAKDAVIEEDFKNTGDSSKAYYALLRFLKQVEDARTN